MTKCGIYIFDVDIILQGSYQQLWENFSETIIQFNIREGLAVFESDQHRCKLIKRKNGMIWRK